MHELVHTGWGWAVQQFELQLTDFPWKWNVIGLLVIAVVVSILLYHLVEEPARRWMRRMVDTRDVRDANAGTGPGASGNTKLRPIDGAREAVSAKAV